MDWGRRVTTALTVFTVGGIAALPFYHGPKTSEAVPRATETDAPANPTTSVVLQIPASEMESTAPEPRIVDTSAPPPIEPTKQPITKRIAVEHEKPPPIISNDFPNSSQQVPQVTATKKIGSKRRDVGSNDELRHGDGPKIHRIRDGDTLRTIAQRYLKDESRWFEVLELNRSVLRDPELLPVGTDIRIPEQGVTAPDSVAPNPTTTPKDEPLTPLVPIR